MITSLKSCLGFRETIAILANNDNFANCSCKHETIPSERGGEHFSPPAFCHLSIACCHGKTAECGKTEPRNRTASHPVSSAPAMRTYVRTTPQPRPGRGRSLDFACHPEEARISLLELCQPAAAPARRLEPADYQGITPGQRVSRRWRLCAQGMSVPTICRNFVLFSEVQVLTQKDQSGLTVQPGSGS